VIPNKSSSPLILIQAADKMLYKAKEQGGNQLKG
jgi:PleD family two-component response regulator